MTSRVVYISALLLLFATEKTYSLALSLKWHRHCTTTMVVLSIEYRRHRHHHHNDNNNNNGAVCVCVCHQTMSDTPAAAAAGNYIERVPQQQQQQPISFFVTIDRERERESKRKRRRRSKKKITCFRLSPILSTYVTFYNKVGSSERGREGECACTQLFYQDINVILSLSFTVKYSKERERECALPPSLFYGWMDGWMEGGFALSPFNLVTRA